MKLRSAALAAALVATAVAFVGCEWSGGGDNGFNTSRNGLDVNISGVYHGSLSGGKAVSMTSGANITRFVINQTGNALEIIDSNGQTYRGTAGSPGAVIDLAAATAAGVIPSGASIATYQVFFSGKDGVAAKDIEFTGIIDVITVTDVKGDSTTQDITSSQATEQSTENSSGSSSSSGNSSESSTDNNSSLNVNTDGTSEGSGGETTSTGSGGDVTNTGNALEQTTTGSESFDTSTSSSSSSNSEDSREASSSTTSSSTSSTGNDVSRSITTTFELTEANSQFRLRGTWIEAGGFVSEADARSAGAGLLSASVVPGADGTNANN